MELFERIKQLRGHFGDYRKIYEPMGLQQQKFQSYLSITSQKNLWQYLPKLTEAYPEISRPWLYWGEGPMFISPSQNIQTQEPATNVQNIDLAEANKVLAETNQRLVEELLKRK